MALPRATRASGSKEATRDQHKHAGDDGRGTRRGNPGNHAATESSDPPARLNLPNRKEPRQ